MQQGRGEGRGEGRTFLTAAPDGQSLGRRLPGVGGAAGVADLALGPSHRGGGQEEGGEKAGLPPLGPGPEVGGRVGDPREVDRRHRVRRRGTPEGRKQLPLARPLKSRVSEGGARRSGGRREDDRGFPVTQCPHLGHYGANVGLLCI
ncbi:hypothetical protein NHX12_013705 [Muraenolepis orangiensis]|uniref:Uncharacterized protein n=1 Tax=Muraenolepis orangiensis TaxID=630683 RepID=A0A9Q0I329_9TELE|nr:hypothetical protein NHX12_013705 [Muraenolepis orangiensis]